MLRQRANSIKIISETLSTKGDFMDKKILNDATLEIAHFMFNVGITEKPELFSFEDDGGIFERLFNEHITEPQVAALKTISEDLYLRVLGMHAFGAGAYLAAKELDFGKSAAVFTAEEIDGIFFDFDTKDAFELALEKMGFATDSGNKQMLDRVIIIGMKETKLVAKEKVFEPQNLKAFMQVLFNAGASMYYLRKS